MASRLPVGEPWATIQAGFFCTTRRVLNWSGGQADQRIAVYQEPFRDELQKAGYKVEGGSEDLFATPSATANVAEFSVGALITDHHLRVCAPDLSGGRENMVKGEDTMTVEWQVYARLQHQVVARIQTSGRFELKSPTPGGSSVLIAGAFRENVRQLSASPEFRKAITAPNLAAGEVVTPAAQTPIPLVGALHSQARPVRDAPVDVVVIYAGDRAMGSGFLVSTDGYMLTDAHVVGAAKTVSIRWPDGLERVGEVVRTSAERDVALIKTDPRGRSPLPLRRDLPQVGETVYAIGAPVSRELAGTVTRGVVSATRVLNGYTYIQSDVAVNPGNSGGPLLDEQGRVVGLTEAGVRTSIISGLNLFIPAGDAIDFLALTLR